MTKPQRFVLRADDTVRVNVLANCKRFLDLLPSDKSWQIEIAPLVKSRSNGQCQYLNGVAYKVIGDALGFDRDDISEYLCGQYFGWRDKPLPGGRSTQVPIRTTTTDADGKRDVLSAKAFSDYVEFCQRFAAEHGIYVPDPNEYSEAA
jgi:hypothetical protein